MTEEKKKLGHEKQDLAVVFDQMSRYRLKAQSKSRSFNSPKKPKYNFWKIELVPTFLFLKDTFAFMNKLPGLRAKKTKEHQTRRILKFKFLGIRIFGNRIIEVFQTQESPPSSKSCLNKFAQDDQLQLYNKQIKKYQIKCENAKHVSTIPLEIRKQLLSMTLKFMKNFRTGDKSKRELENELEKIKSFIRNTLYKKYKLIDKLDTFTITSDEDLIDFYKQIRYYAKILNDKAKELKRNSSKLREKKPQKSKIAKSQPNYQKFQYLTHRVASAVQKRGKKARPYVGPVATAIGATALIIFIILGAMFYAQPVTGIEKDDEVKLQYTIWGVDDMEDTYGESDILYDGAIWMKVEKITDSSGGMILGLYSNLLDKEVGYKSEDIFLRACIDQDLDGKDDIDSSKALSYGVLTNQYYNQSIRIKFIVLNVKYNPDGHKPAVSGEWVWIDALSSFTSPYIQVIFGLTLFIAICMLTSHFHEWKKGMKKLEKLLSERFSATPQRRWGLRAVLTAVISIIAVVLCFMFFNLLAIELTFMHYLFLIAGIGLVALFHGIVQNIGKLILYKRKNNQRHCLSVRTKKILCATIFIIGMITFCLFLVPSSLLVISFLAIVATGILLYKFMPAKRDPVDVGMEHYPGTKSMKKKLIKGKRFKIKHNIQKFIAKKRGKATLICLAMLLSTVMYFFMPTLQQLVLSNPQFSMVDNHIRRAGDSYELSELDYVDDPKDLGEVKFNSLLVLRFNTTIMTGKEITYFAELIPEDEFMPHEKEYAYSQTHYFTSDQFKGPLLNEPMYFELDLDSTNTPVLPGKYTLKVYSIHRYLFRFQTSNVEEYTIRIKKDEVRFTPLYDSDPGLSDRKGSIYSIRNSERTSYDTYYSCIMENSLGKPIAGTVQLYLTERQGFQPVFGKLTDYKIKSDGRIDYMVSKRSHFREYQQGKIFYDGSQSLFYKTATHWEDSEISKNKFIHTASGQYGDRDEYTSNGTDWQTFNRNTFELTTHLKYVHNFHSQELQWTKYVNSTSNPKPTYQHEENATIDFIYLDVDKDDCPSGNTLNTYIESPIIGYVGTQADIATFTYSYRLYKHVIGNEEQDGIHAEITVQVYRDTKLVYEGTSYNGYVNTPNQDWQTINIPLTEFFSEGGQIFTIKIATEFTFDPACDDEISLRFDHAKLEVFYPPTYYKGFDFSTGFNELAARSAATAEANFWDSDHPLTLGRNILYYDQYPGLLTNNEFGQDFRIDASWESFSGLFYEDENGNPVFIREDGIGLQPSWTEYDGDGMAVFNLKATDGSLNVSAPFEAIIADEFTSISDSDSTLATIRERYIVPKVVATKDKVIVVFAGRSITDDSWKIYYTWCYRPDGTFSAPQRVYDPGDDNIYQLAPALALSKTDLYVVWQQRNQADHPSGESEWVTGYARLSLDDFSLQDVKNITTYDSSNLDETALVAPDLALTPLANLYTQDGELLTMDCMVHVAYENATWTDLTPGDRDNDHIDYINKYLFYTKLNSAYTSTQFSAPFMINDLAGNSINTDGNLEAPQIIGQTSYNTSMVFADSKELFLNFLDIIHTYLPSQPENFTISEGSIDTIGDLLSLDYDYSSFLSELFENFNSISYCYTLDNAPHQNNNFIMYNGTILNNADLYSIDGNNKTILSGEGAGGGSNESVYVVPNEDITTNWATNPSGNPHYSNIDGYPSEDTSSNIVAYQNDDGLIEEFGMTTQTFADCGDFLTLRFYSWRWLGGGTVSDDLKVDIYAGSWLGEQTVSTPLGYAWREVSWSGLDLNQSDINNMRIKLKAPTTITGSNALLVVTSVGVNLNITTRAGYMNFTTEWQYNNNTYNPNDSLQDVKLYYSHKTNCSLDELSLDIWNYNTSQWVLVNNTDNYQNFYDNYYTLNSSYYNASNYVKIRYIGKRALGLFTLQIEKLALIANYSRYELDVNYVNFTTSLQFDSSLPLDDIDLIYSLRTDIVQSVTISIWNYQLSRWDLLESSNFTELTERTFRLSSNYYNESREVLVNFYAYNVNETFTMFLEQLKVGSDWYELNFTAHIQVDPQSNFNDLILSFAHSTDFDHKTEVEIFNHDLAQWDHIGLYAHITIQEHSFGLNSSYIDQNSTVTLRFSGTNRDDAFKLNLDELKVISLDRQKRVFEIRSIWIEEPDGDIKELISSEEEFVERFGTEPLQLDKNSISFSNDLLFEDLYDNRKYEYLGKKYNENITQYSLAAFFYDEVASVRYIKDIFVSDTPLIYYQVEPLGTRLSRDSYSIAGEYGTDDLKIIFNEVLQDGQIFYIKYTFDEYILPAKVGVEVSTIKNEVAFAFEQYLNETDQKIYLDITNETFQFQDDILIINSLSSINCFPDIKYDLENNIHVIYSSRGKEETPEGMGIINGSLIHSGDLYGIDSDFMSFESTTDAYDVSPYLLEVDSVSYNYGGHQSGSISDMDENDGVNYRSYDAFIDELYFDFYRCEFDVYMNESWDTTDAFYEIYLDTYCTSSDIELFYATIGSSQITANGQTLFINGSKYANVDKIRIFASDSTIIGGFTSFYLDTDWIRARKTEYTRPELNITASIQMDGPLDNIKLFTSYKTNVSQPITLSVWNFGSSQWDELSSSNFDSFSEQIYDINSTHCNQNNEIYVNFYGKDLGSIFNLESFTLDIEMLRVGGTCNSSFNTLSINTYGGEDRALLKSFDFRLIDNSSNYDYYNIINPIIDLGPNGSYFIAYETKFKEVDGTDQRKVQYLYVDSVYGDSVIPSQPQSFTIINGTSDFAGDLTFIDGSFTTFMPDTTLNFTVVIDPKEGGVSQELIDSANLVYSFTTNNSQPVVVSLWNHELKTWETIDSTNYDLFTEHSYPLEPCYFSESYELLVSFHANTSTPFEFKLDLLKVDLTKQTIMGPFNVESDSSEQFNPNSYYYNGLFWTYLKNSTTNHTVEYISQSRADFVSFSTLSADFIPTIYDNEEYQADMNVYFDINLENFNNNQLEADDTLRFIVSLEHGSEQCIILDTGWEVYNLTTWIHANLGTYYPLYLRYYYNLPLTGLTYSQIYGVDENVQNGIYPFEISCPEPVVCGEIYRLRFNLVKNGWALNTTGDNDRYQMAIDHVDMSFEITPKDNAHFTLPVQQDPEDPPNEFYL